MAGLNEADGCSHAWKQQQVRIFRIQHNGVGHNIIGSSRLETHLTNCCIKDVVWKTGNREASLHSFFDQRNLRFIHSGQNFHGTQIRSHNKHGWRGHAGLYRITGIHVAVGNNSIYRRANFRIFQLNILLLEINFSCIKLRLGCIYSHLQCTDILVRQITLRINRLAFIQLLDCFLVGGFTLNQCRTG